MQLTQPPTTCRFLGYGQSTIPNQHGRAGETVFNTRSLPDLLGRTPVDVRICMPKVRISQRVADDERTNPLCRMPPSAVRYGGHCAARLAYAAADLVSGDVVRLREQERDECPESSAAAGAAELQYGMALSAQATKGYGEIWTGGFVRDRRGGRVILRRPGRGQKRTWGVWKTDYFRSGGSARPQNRKNQAIAHSRCVGCHAGTSCFGSCVHGHDCSDRRVAGIQQRHVGRIHTRGGCGERGRIGEYCAAQMPSCRQPSETLDTGNATRQCRERTFAGLFERVHIQVQPEKLKEPWSPVLQIGTAGSRHATKSPIRNCAATRCCGWLSQLHTQF